MEDRRSCVFRQSGTNIFRRWKNIVLVVKEIWVLLVINSLKNFFNLRKIY